MILRVNSIPLIDGAEIRQRQQPVPREKARSRATDDFGKVFDEACEDLRRAENEAFKKD